MNAFGNGRAVLMGTLAGLAFLAPAVTASAQVLPTEFSEPLRQVVATPARVAGAARPAVALNPLVETQWMQGPDGVVVALINWGPVPVPDLTLTFNPALKVEKVRSLRAAGFFRGLLDEQARGAMAVKSVNGKPQVQLRLEVSDYLLINWTESNRFLFWPSCAK